MSIQKNRRQFWRAHFHSPVQFVAHGQATAAELYDISLKGALLQVPVGWTGKIGDRSQLRLDLAPDAKISMNARIAHIDGRRVGLHCEDIDVDSATHLRRLVALNSGDPQLLDRELSSLLDEAADQGG